ncbi:MAG: GH3 family domain-containing protein [Candidatus Asgardarchaeia archaeon]
MKRISKKILYTTYKLLQKLTHEKAVLQQKETLMKIIKENMNTYFGKIHHFDKIKSIEDYQSNVNISTYSTLSPFISQIANGEENILFRDNVCHWVKSSGTTGAPKLYPITSKRVKIDKTLSRRLFLNVLKREPTIINGRFLFFAAPAITDYINGMPVGYISGVLATSQNVLLQKFFLPSKEVINTKDTKKKYNETLRIIEKKRITALIGVTPFLVSLLRKAKEKKLHLKIREELEVIVWSGVPILPFKKWIMETIGDHILFVSSYVGSEGFYGFETAEDKECTNTLATDSLFFEFVKLEDIKQNPSSEVRRYTIENVKKNTSYLMLVTTFSGLYSYNIGDVIEFVDLDPPRIRVKGRINNILNIATEKVTEEEVNIALSTACSKNDCTIERYLIIPYVDSGIGKYILFVSFARKPKNIRNFLSDFDNTLMKNNEVYRLVRTSYILDVPEIIVISRDFFDQLDNCTISRSRALGQAKTPSILLPNHYNFKYYKPVINELTQYE